MVRKSGRTPAPPGHQLPVLLSVLTVLLPVLWAAPVSALPPGQEQVPVEVSEDPLVSRQWYLGWRNGPGSQSDGEGVSIGVVDSGVDAAHPEIEESYDASRSRSFLTSCGSASRCPDLDPGYDPYGHGTGVAGIITADADGYGITGAAPGARIVSLKAGNAQGRFYASAVARAIRYAADIHLDILVMSFTTDPWFRYCEDAPGDTEDERRQQADDLAIITSALQYAAEHGVVMVAAGGNEAFDLDHGTIDLYSTGWSGDGERPVNDQCVTMPAQSENVIAVGALDSTGVRASYSNTGSAIDVTAPGGTPVYHDDIGTLHGQDSAIFTTAPTNVIRGAGLDGNGVSQAPGVVSDCGEGPDRCRYFWYQFGTSFAAPQVAAAAADLMSSGTPASEVREVLTRLASPTACPAQVGQDLPCRETPERPGQTNTWYGHGKLRIPAVRPTDADGQKGKAGHG